MRKAKNLMTTLEQSIQALDQIDELAGDDISLQEIGRELGLEEFKIYMGVA